MNGIRMFVTVSNALPANNVFYSQRSHGPLYCWRYETKGEFWRVARVNPGDCSKENMSLTRWKALPQELRAKLKEHYVD